MRRNFTKDNILLFLIGTFSMTQIRIGGNIGISELVMAILAPFVYLQDIRNLRRDGFLPVVHLALLVCLGCCVASVANHTQFRNFIRGIASPYVIFSTVVVLHRILVRNLNGFKWLMFGSALTLVINVFAFQTGRSDAGDINGQFGDAVDIVTSNTLFWISRLKPWILLPIEGWYLQVPVLYSASAPFLFAAYCLATTPSGRSTAMGIVGASALILFCGKSAAKMRMLQKHFLILCLATIAGGLIFKNVYKELAQRGVLGEAAQIKYEKQSAGGSSVLKLLVAGRTAFFAGLMACVDRPIIGYGPWALDTNGYYEECIRKYGSVEDYEEMMFWKSDAAKYGRTQGVSILPAHSHIIGFWSWYGIFGLLFWLYVLWLFVLVFMKYLTAIPQWFGFFALSIPTGCWAIFFSPFNGRVTIATVIVAVLFARAVAKHSIQLPYSMQLEVFKHAM